MSNNDPHAWRFAWKLEHEINPNDKRIIPNVDFIIEGIKHKKDGHQRELLKILEKIKLTQEQEGKLFDLCISLWKRIDKSPSVRIKAFQQLCKTASKYPELKKELIHFTSEEYTQTLGKGIKKSFDRFYLKTF